MSSLGSRDSGSRRGGSRSRIPLAVMMIKYF